MRKTYLQSVLVLTALFAGCTKEEAPAETPEPTEEPVVFTVWDKEPSMEYSSVKIPEPLYKTEIRYESKNYGTLYVLAQQDRKGYPAQWNNEGYTPDAVIVSDGTKQGFADYSGQEIYPPTVNVHSTPFAAGIVSGRSVSSSGSVRHPFGAVNTTTSSAMCFSNDFRTTDQYTLEEFNYDPYRANAFPFFAVKNDVFGVAVPLYDSEGSFTYEFGFEKYQGPALSGRLIVPVVDEMFYTQKYVLCEPDGKILGPLASGRGTYREDSFINGVYVIAQANEATYIKVGTGQIGLTYNEAMYFEDGYAPVARNGKWAFINDQGKEICDFIFDSALPSYNGMSWVKYNGKWGILNIRRAMEHDGALSVSSLFPSTEEAKGTVTVTASSLTIRTGASTSAQKAGMCRKGAVYQVYDTKESDGYTWYRVSREHWVPTDGTWLTYSE